MKKLTHASVSQKSKKFGYGKVNEDHKKSDITKLMGEAMSVQNPLTPFNKIANPSKKNDQILLDSVGGKEDVLAEVKATPAALKLLLSTAATGQISAYFESISFSTMLKEASYLGTNSMWTGSQLIALGAFTAYVRSKTESKKRVSDEDRTLATSIERRFGSTKPFMVGANFIKRHLRAQSSAA